MARYYLQVCANIKCESFIKEEKASHKMMASDKDQWAGQCEKCGQMNTREAPHRTKSAHKWVYPYFHSGLGVKLESESHEQKIVKEQKLEKV